jgi:chromosome segregation ATPase
MSIMEMEMETEEEQQIILQELATFREELANLPDAVGQAVGEALTPLQEAGGSIQEIVSVQRRVLDEMAEEITNRAGAAFGDINQKTFQPLKGHLATLETSLRDMQRHRASMQQEQEKTAAAAEKLANLTNASTAKLNEMLERHEQGLTSTTNKLMDSAQSLVTGPWQRMLFLVCLGCIGGLAAAGGQVVFERLVPPSAMQKRLALWDEVWAKATPKEQELIQKIVDRPVK